MVSSYETSQNMCLLTCLSADVFKSGKPSEQVAIDWMKQFEDDNAIALKELVNLVLRSAGCEQEVTVDDINDPDNVPNKLNDMQEEERNVRYLSLLT